MNKLFQQMNKIEAEITAGLKDEVRDGTDEPGSAPDGEPRQAPAPAAAKPASAGSGSGEMAKLRQQLKQVETRLSEKVRRYSHPANKRSYHP
jgi:hypothetical protein